MRRRKRQGPHQNELDHPSEHGEDAGPGVDAANGKEVALADVRVERVLEAADEDWHLVLDLAEELVGGVDLVVQEHEDVLEVLGGGRGEDLGGDGPVVAGLGEEGDQRADAVILVAPVSDVPRVLHLLGRRLGHDGRAAAVPIVIIIVVVEFCLAGVVLFCCFRPLHFFSSSSSFFLSSTMKRAEKEQRKDSPCDCLLLLLLRS